MNALHHLYLRSSDPLTRQLVLVQTAAYMAGMPTPPGDGDVLALEPIPIAELDEIFDAVPSGPSATAARVLGWVEGGGDLEAVYARAEQLAVEHAAPVDEHSYKFPVAVVEESTLASTRWKGRVLAAIGGEYGRSPSTATPMWVHYDEVLAEIEQL
jgi:hypothetical protein